MTMDDAKTKDQADQTAKDGQISLSALAQPWDRGLDLDGATPNRPPLPYAQTSWLYICVNEVIKACRSVQMMISTEADKIVESGEAYDLLFRNPKMSFTTFISETAGYLALDREVYWVFADIDIVRPTSILVVGKDQLKPVIRRGELVGYMLRLPGGDRIPLFLEDVHPLVDYNPYDAYRGIGPTTAGKIAISSSYQASLLNEAALANGGKIGNLITVPGSLGDDERRMLISQFESRHKGAHNAGKTCLMTGGADLKRLAQTMAEMEMIELRKFDAAEICALMGVPPEIVGLNSEAQYSHGPAQQRFIANTIAPTLSFIAEHVTDGILSRFRHRSRGYKAVTPAQSRSYCSSQRSLTRKSSYRAAKIKSLQSGQNLFAWFAIEDHPTMQEMVRERAEKVLKYTERGVPLNQCIDAFDLPFEHVPWGDDWWVSMGLVPAKFALEGGIDAVLGPSLPEGESDEDEDEGKYVKQAEPSVVKKDTEQQKLRIWRKWTVSWVGLEKEYTAAVRSYLQRQRRILTDKLAKALEQKGAKSANDIIARVVFDMKVESGKIKVINKTFCERGAELGIRQSIIEIAGLTGDDLEAAVRQAKLSPAVRRAITVSSHKITKINKTTQDRVARQLKTGLEKGEGLKDLTGRLTDALGIKHNRARGIARTQTSGAVSTGRHEGMKSSGVETRSWLTSRDSNVRDTHRQAEADSAAGIPIDQPFTVGGERLMYPGDPAGSAANIANCRCMAIARYVAGKSLDLDYYDTVKFFSYYEMKSFVA